MPERRTGGTGSSSSHGDPTWEITPQGEEFLKRNGLWPTPRASPNENRTTHHAPTHGAGHGKTLAGEAVGRNWPTPTRQDAAGSGAAAYPATETRNTGTTLTDAAVRNWCTPRATDGSNGGPNQRDSKGGLALPSQAAKWPTPGASDAKSPKTFAGGNPSLTTRAKNLATHSDSPSEIDGSSQPTEPCKQWPTPSATSYGTNQGGAAGRTGPVRPSLDTLAKNWATPTSRDWKDGTCASADVPTNALPAKQSVRWESPLPASGPPAPTTSTGGAKSSTSGRTLNPRFVEWLMGWPVGWTEVRPPIESTVSASAVTASSPPNAPSRSAFSGSVRSVGLSLI